MGETFKDNVVRLARRLFVLLAAFKASEFANGLFRGWAAWIARGLAVLLFFGAYLITELGPAQQTGKVARRMRASLLVLLVVSLVWDALRATDAVVSHRMEYDRLVQVHKEMERAERERLRPLYKGYERLLRRRGCGQPPECSELHQGRKEIAEFLLKRPEPPDHVRELRTTLRMRQSRLQELLLSYPVASKDLPEPVEFPLSPRRYSYWEMTEWIFRNPYTIEVQALFAKLVRNGLVLTTTLILAVYLQSLVLEHPSREPVVPKRHPWPFDPLRPPDWRDGRVGHPRRRA